MKKQLNNYIFSLFAPLLLLIAITAHADPKVTLISSTTGQLHFKIKLDKSSINQVTTVDNHQLFYKSLKIAVPQNSQVVLESINGLKTDEFSQLEKTRPIYQTDNLAEISIPKNWRGANLATLTIYPVAGNIYYSEIEVVISFISDFNNNQSDQPYQLSNNSILETAVINRNILSSSFTQKPQLAKPSAINGPFDNFSQWYKIEIGETGLCRLTVSQLHSAGLDVSSLISSQIHLYNGGGEELDVFNQQPRPQFTEISIIVEDGGDGLFNNQDYILFYGESVNRYTTVDNSFKYIENHYTDRNIYWLNISDSTPGLRINQKDASLSGVGGAVDKTVSSFIRQIRIEQNNILRQFNNGKFENYFRWYWSNDDSLEFFINIAGLIPGDTTIVSISGRTLDTTGGDDTRGYFDLFVNGLLPSFKACNLDSCVYKSTDFTVGANQIEIHQMYNSAAKPYFDYMEIKYPSLILPMDNQLDFPFGIDSGVIQFEMVNDFSGTPKIFDISQPLNPVQLTNFQVGSLIQFYDSLAPANFNRYYAVDESRFTLPLTVSQVDPVDLYRGGSSADLMIVTPRNFIDALDEYITFRTDQGYSIEIYALEDIFDNFSWGLYDPTAIRDFLKYQYENTIGDKPGAVLFVGDGSYDYLNRLGTNLPNFVPPYIHRYDISSSDDNYVYFGEYGLVDGDSSYIKAGDQGWDMASARWPIRSREEINLITNKIKLYESSANLGIWRNNVTLVADDEFGSFNNEDFHTVQTEELSNYHIPSSVNRDKIYLWDYPFVNGLKPAVNTRLVNSINDGTLIVNYVGHGNPDIWAHESIFTRTDDLPRLNNGYYLSLFFAASCAIGFFDDPFREGMAEELLTISNSGAIGVISATRLVYSSDNAAYNRQVFDLLYDGSGLTICEAVYKAKLLRQYFGSIPIIQKNDRNYLYFGDPLLKLGIPKEAIAFDLTIDTLTALKPVTISGRVVDSMGNTIAEDGLLSINVFDSDRDKTYRLLNSSGVVIKTIPYSVSGPLIYRGSVSISSGQFDFSFIPPLDIGFGGQAARIMVYAKLGQTDASGIEDNIIVSNEIVVSSDSAGPAIEVAISGRTNFVSGDYINRNDEMMITLEDSSGINLAGGLGHGITLEIDNRPDQIKNITTLFNYDQNDFHRGSLSLTLEDLSVGSHSFKIKAWDNANNYSTYQFTAEISADNKLQIVDLLNYPNPMKDSTTISYTITAPIEKMTVEIFTLSGRKIRSFTRHSLVPDYYDDIIWYGKDFSGDRVATEVYIYKATAYPSGGGKEAESFGKIILVN